MTGLLGNGWDDPQSAAIMALSGGLLQGNFAGGLLGANQAYAEHGDRKLRRGLLEAQIAETQAQAQERQSKLLLAQQAQARQDAFLNGGGGMSPGAFAPSSDGMGPTLPQGAAPQSGGVIAQARAMGIPESAIQADVIFNGGKKISELLAKHGAPNWQNVNGNLVNTNAQGFQGGLQAGMSAGNDGRVTAWQPDGQGGLVVGAPKGAFDTFGKYQQIQQGAAADFDLKEVTPQGGPPQLTTRGALVRNPQISGRPQAPNLDAGRVEILNQEVTKAQAQLQAALQAGDSVAAQRAATDLSSLNRELGRAGGASRASVGMPLQSEAERTRAVDDAKAASARDATMQKGAMNSRDTLNYIKEARALFKKGPTASGFGSLVDAGANLVGFSTPGADAAAQLDTLSGWMVSNVPRMEGPQSNFDVQNYKTMAGMVGDKSKPLSQRLAALDTLERLQLKYAHLNGGVETNPAPATVAQGAFSDAAKEQRYQAWKRSQGK